VTQLSARVDALSDESLLAGMAARDHEACMAFIRRFEGTVYGLALRMLGDRPLAEDVAQETFSRAWCHAHTHDPRRGAVSTWLLTIARNLAVDTLRLRRPDPLDPHTLALHDGLLSTDVEPCDAAIHAHERQRVRAAIAQLPLEQRRALVLSTFGGCTAKQISRVEQIPLGTAKTRIRAGLHKVRAILEDEEVFDD